MPLMFWSATQCLSPLSNHCPPSYPTLPQFQKTPDQCSDATLPRSYVWETNQRVNKIDVIRVTYCLRRVDVVLVPVLSFLSSLPLSFSTGAEPHDRPRLSLVWVLLAGPGTVDDGKLLLLSLWTVLTLWFVKDDGPLDFELCSWLWFCVELSASGVLSKRRSWFSWLTRSSCVSSSSMRRRCVSRSLAWFSIILLSSRRYSTARLGLSGFDSIIQTLVPGAKLLLKGIIFSPSVHPPPPHTELFKWGGDG